MSRDVFLFFPVFPAFESFLTNVFLTPSPHSASAIVCTLGADSLPVLNHLFINLLEELFLKHEIHFIWRAAETGNCFFLALLVLFSLVAAKLLYSCFASILATRQVTRATCALDFKCMPKYRTCTYASDGH